MVMRTNHDVMEKDSYTTSHPIYQPVAHPDEINEIFDSITYSKVSILSLCKTTNVPCFPTKWAVIVYMVILFPPCAGNFWW